MNLQYLTDAYIRNYRRINSAKDINNGDCFRWALLAHQLHGGTLVSVTVNVERYAGGYELDCAHAFLDKDRKYFDAEVPEGILNWRELPFFQRVKNHYCDLSPYRLTRQVHPSVASFADFWQPSDRTCQADNRLYNKLRNS